MAILVGILGVVAPARAWSIADLPNYLYLGFSYILQAICALVGQATVMVTGLLTSVIVYNDFITFEAVTLGWVLVRDICNMFFVIVLLMIAIATILRVESYNLKRMLPKLVIMAVLVNFSRVIAGLFIDAAQVITLTFAKAVVTVTAGNLYAKFGLAELFNISQNAFSTSTEQASSMFYLFIALLLATIMLVIAFSVILAYLVVFSLRIVALWILIILSPLAYVLSTFPQGESYSREWWRTFSKYVTVGPILMFFFWLAIATSQQAFTDTLDSTRIPGSVMSSDSAEKMSASSRIGIGSAGTRDNVLKFLVMTCLMLGGLVAAQRAGVAGSQFAGQIMSTGKQYGMRGLRKMTSLATAPIRKPFAAARWGVREGFYATGRAWDRFAARKYRDAMDKGKRASSWKWASPTVIKKGWQKAREEAERKSFPEATGYAADHFNKMFKKHWTMRRRLLGVPVPTLEGETTYERRKAFRSEVNKAKSEYSSFTEIEKAAALEKAVASKNKIHAFGIMLAQEEVNQNDDDRTAYRGKINSPEAMLEDIEERIGKAFGADAAAELGVMMKEMGEEKTKTRFIHVAETENIPGRDGRKVPTNKLLTEDTAREKLVREGISSPTDKQVRKKQQQMIYSQVQTITGRTKLENLTGSLEGKIDRRLYPVAQPHLNLFTGGGRQHGGVENPAYSTMGDQTALGKVIGAAHPDSNEGKVIAERGHGGTPRGFEWYGGTKDAKHGNEVSVDPRAMYMALKSGKWRTTANLIGRERWKPEQIVAMERILKKMDLRDPSGEKDWHFEDFAQEQQFKGAGKVYDPADLTPLRAGATLPTSFMQDFVTSRTEAQWKKYARKGYAGTTPGAVDIEGKPAIVHEEEIPELFERPGREDDGYAYEFSTTAPAGGGGGGGPIPTPLVGYDPQIQEKSIAAMKKFEAGGLTAEQAAQAYELEHASEIRTGEMYTTAEVEKNKEYAQQQAAAAGKEELNAITGVAGVEHRQLDHEYTPEEIERNPHLASAYVGMNFEDEEVQERYGVKRNYQSVQYDETTEEKKKSKDWAVRNLAEDYGARLREQDAALYRQAVAQKIGINVEDITDDDLGSTQLTPEEQQQFFADYYERQKPASADRRYADRVVSHMAEEEFKAGNTMNRVDEVRDEKTGKTTYRYRDDDVLAKKRAEAMQYMYTEDGVSERQALFKQTLDNTKTLTVHNNAAFGNRFTQARHELGHTYAGQLDKEARLKFRGTLDADQQQIFDREGDEEYMASAMGRNQGRYKMSDQTRKFLDELQVEDIKTGEMALGARYRGRKRKAGETPLVEEQQPLDEKVITQEEVDRIHRERVKNPAVAAEMFINERGQQIFKHRQEMAQADVAVQQANEGVAAGESKVAPLRKQREDLLQTRDLHQANAQAAQARFKKTRNQVDKAQAQQEIAKMRAEEERIRPQLEGLDKKIATAEAEHVAPQQKKLAQAEKNRDAIGARGALEEQQFSAQMGQLTSQMSDAELKEFMPKAQAALIEQEQAAQRTLSEAGKQDTASEKELSDTQSDRRDLQLKLHERQVDLRNLEARDAGAAQTSLQQTQGQLGHAGQVVREQEQVVQTQTENVDNARVEMQNAEVALPEAAAATQQAEAGLQAVNGRLDALVSRREAMTQERDSHLAKQNEASRRLNQARASGNAFAEQQALADATREQELARAADVKIPKDQIQLLNRQIDEQRAAVAPSEVRVTEAKQRQQSAEDDVRARRAAHTEEQKRLTHEQGTLADHQDTRQHLQDRVAEKQQIVDQIGAGASPEQIDEAKKQVDVAAQQLAQVDQLVREAQAKRESQRARYVQTLTAGNAVPGDLGAIGKVVRQSVANAQQQRKVSAAAAPETAPQSSAVSGPATFAESEAKLRKMESDRDELTAMMNEHYTERKKAADRGDTAGEMREARLAQAAERDLARLQEKIVQQQTVVAGFKSDAALKKVYSNFNQQRKENRADVATKEEAVSNSRSHLQQSQSDLGTRVQERDAAQRTLSEANARARQAAADGRLDDQARAMAEASTAGADFTEKSQAVDRQRGAVAEDQKNLQTAEDEYRRAVTDAAGTVETFTESIRVAAGKLTDDEVEEMKGKAQADIEDSNEAAKAAVRRDDQPSAQAAMDKARQAQVVKEQLEFVQQQRQVEAAPEAAQRELREAKLNLGTREFQLPTNLKELGEKKTGLEGQREKIDKKLKGYEEQVLQAEKRGNKPQRDRAEAAAAAERAKLANVEGEIEGVDKEIASWKESVEKAKQAVVQAQAKFENASAAKARGITPPPVVWEKLAVPDAAPVEPKPAPLRPGAGMPTAASVPEPARPGGKMPDSYLKELRVEEDHLAGSLAQSNPDKLVEPIRIRDAELARRASVRPGDTRPTAEVPANELSDTGLINEVNRIAQEKVAAEARMKEIFDQFRMLDPEKPEYRQRTGELQQAVNEQKGNIQKGEDRRKELAVEQKRREPFAGIGDQDLQAERNNMLQQYARGIQTRQRLHEISNEIKRRKEAPAQPSDGSQSSLEPLSEQDWETERQKLADEGSTKVVKLAELRKRRAQLDAQAAEAKRKKRGPEPAAALKGGERPLSGIEFAGESELMDARERNEQANIKYWQDQQAKLEQDIQRQQAARAAGTAGAPSEAETDQLETRRKQAEVNVGRGQARLSEIGEKRKKLEKRRPAQPPADEKNLDEERAKVAAEERRTESDLAEVRKRRQVLNSRRPRPGTQPTQEAEEPAASAPMSHAPAQQPAAETQEAVEGHAEQLEKASVGELAKVFSRLAADIQRMSSNISTLVDREIEKSEKGQPNQSAQAKDAKNNLDSLQSTLRDALADHQAGVPSDQLATDYRRQSLDWLRQIAKNIRELRLDEREKGEAEITDEPGEPPESNPQGQV